jgi:hypothetical protein
MEFARNVRQTAWNAQELTLAFPARKVYSNLTGTAITAGNRARRAMRLKTIALPALKAFSLVRNIIYVRSVYRSVIYAMMKINAANALGDII